MPVYDHIHPQISGVLYSLVDQLFQFCLAAAGTIAAVLRRIHGQPDRIYPPGIPQCPKGFFIHILRIPGQAVGGYAFYYKALSFGIHHFSLAD